MAGGGPEVRILRAPELGNSSFLVADRETGEADTRGSDDEPIKAVNAFGHFARPYPSTPGSS